MNPSSSYKNEKTKRFAASDINAHYQGKSTEVKARTQQRYGLQKVGSVQGTRRLPQPVWVPSIRSESGMHVASSSALSGTGSISLGSTSSGLPVTHPARPFSTPSQSESTDAGTVSGATTKWQRGVKPPSTPSSQQPGGLMQGFSGEDFPRLEEAGVSVLTTVGNNVIGSDGRTVNYTDGPGTILNPPSLKPQPGMDWMERRRLAQLQKQQQQTSRSHSTEESTLGRSNSPPPLGANEIADIKKMLLESESQETVAKSGPPPITRLQSGANAARFSTPASAAQGQSSRLAFCQTAVSTEKEKFVISIPTCGISTNSTIPTVSTTSTGHGPSTVPGSGGGASSSGRPMGLLASMLPSNATEGGGMSRADYFNTGWAAMDEDEDMMSGGFGAMSSEKSISKPGAHPNSARNKVEHDLQGPNFDELLVFSDEEDNNQAPNPSSVPSSTSVQPSNFSMSRPSPVQHHQAAMNMPLPRPLLETSGNLLESAPGGVLGGMSSMPPSLFSTNYNMQGAEKIHNWPPMQQRRFGNDVSDPLVCPYPPGSGASHRFPPAVYSHQYQPAPIGTVSMSTVTPPTHAVLASEHTYRPVAPPAPIGPGVIGSHPPTSYLPPRPPYMPTSSWMPNPVPGNMVPPLFPSMGKPQQQQQQRREEEDESEERNTQGHDVYWNAINRARTMRAEQQLQSNLSGDTNNTAKLTAIGSMRPSTQDTDYLPVTSKPDTNLGMTDWFERDKLSTSDTRKVQSGGMNAESQGDIRSLSSDTVRTTDTTSYPPQPQQPPSSAAVKELHPTPLLSYQSTDSVKHVPTHQYPPNKPTDYRSPAQDERFRGEEMPRAASEGPTKVTHNEGTDKFKTGKGGNKRPSGRDQTYHQSIGNWSNTSSFQDARRNNYPEQKQRSWRGGSYEEFGDYEEYNDVSNESYQGGESGRYGSGSHARGYPPSRSSNTYSAEDSYPPYSGRGGTYQPRKGHMYPGGMTLSRSVNADEGYSQRRDRQPGRWEGNEATSGPKTSSTRKEKSVEKALPLPEEAPSAGSQKAQMNDYCAEEYTGPVEEEVWIEETSSQSHKMKPPSGRGRSGGVLTGGRVFTRKSDKPGQKESTKQTKAGALAKGKMATENNGTRNAKSDHPDTEVQEGDAGDGPVTGNSPSMPTTKSEKERKAGNSKNVENTPRITGKVTPLFSESERQHLVAGGGVPMTATPPIVGNASGTGGTHPRRKGGRGYDEYYHHGGSEGSWRYDYEPRRGNTDWYGGGYMQFDGYGAYDEQYYQDYKGRNDTTRPQRGRGGRNKGGNSGKAAASSLKGSSGGPVSRGGGHEEPQQTHATSDMPTSEGNEAEEWETASEGNDGTASVDNAPSSTRPSEGTNGHHAASRGKKPASGHHRPTFDSDTAGRQRAYYRNNPPRGGGSGGASRGAGSASGSGGGGASSNNAAASTSKSSGKQSSGGSGSSKPPTSSTSANQSHNNSKATEDGDASSNQQNNNAAVTSDNQKKQPQVQPPRRPKLQVDTSVFSNVVLAESLPQVTEEELLMETMQDREASANTNSTTRDVITSGVLGFQEVLSKATRRTRKRLEEQAELQRKKEEIESKVAPQSKEKPVRRAKGRTKGVASNSEAPSSGVAPVEVTTAAAPLIVEGPKPLLDEMELLSVQKKTALKNHQVSGPKVAPHSTSATGGEGEEKRFMEIDKWTAVSTGKSTVEEKSADNDATWLHTSNNNSILKHTVSDAMDIRNHNTLKVAAAVGDERLSTAVREKERERTPSSVTMTEENGQFVLSQNGKSMSLASMTSTSTASNVCKVRPQQQQQLQTSNESELQNQQQQQQQMQILPTNNVLNVTESNVTGYSSDISTTPSSTLFFDNRTMPPPPHFGMPAVTQVPNENVHMTTEGPPATFDANNASAAAAYSFHPSKFAATQAPVMRAFAPVVSELAWPNGLSASCSYPSPGPLLPHMMASNQAAFQPAPDFTNSFNGQPRGAAAGNVWNVAPAPPTAPPPAQFHHALLQHHPVASSNLPAPIARPSTVAGGGAVSNWNATTAGGDSTASAADMAMFSNGAAPPPQPQPPYQPASLWEMASQPPPNLAHHPATALLHHQVGGTVSPGASMLAQLSLGGSQALRHDMLVASDAQQQRVSQSAQFTLAALYNPHYAATASHTTLFSGPPSGGGFLGNGTLHELTSSGGAGGGGASGPRFPQMSGQAVSGGPRMPLLPHRLAAPTGPLFAPPTPNNSSMEKIDFSEMFGLSQHTVFAPAVVAPSQSAAGQPRPMAHPHVSTPLGMFGAPRPSTSNQYPPPVASNPPPHLGQFSHSLSGVSGGPNMYETSQLSGISAESLAQLSQPEMQRLMMHMSKYRGGGDASRLQQKVPISSTFGSSSMAVPYPTGMSGNTSRRSTSGGAHQQYVPRHSSHKSHYHPHKSIPSSGEPTPSVESTDKSSSLTGEFASSKSQAPGPLPETCPSRSATASPSAKSSISSGGPNNQSSVATAAAAAALVSVMAPTLTSAE